jgi:AbiV family abortive infection protein
MKSRRVVLDTEPMWKRTRSSQHLARLSAQMRRLVMRFTRWMMIRMNVESKPQRKSKHVELSADQMAELVTAVIANSRALHASAGKLLGSDGYAQAYLLDHFGAEEVPKANLIYAQWLAVQSGRTPQWDVFWKIFRRHDLKTTNAIVAGAIDEAMRALRSLKPPADSIPESPPSAVGSIEHLPVLRPIMTRLYQFAAMNRGRCTHDRGRSRSEPCPRWGCRRGTSPSARGSHRAVHGAAPARR